MDSPPPPTRDDERRALVRQLLERRGVRASGGAGIGRRPDGAAIPLSFPQQRLWFLHQLDPGDVGVQPDGRPLAVGAPERLRARRRALAHRRSARRTADGVSDRERRRCGHPRACDCAGPAGRGPERRRSGRAATRRCGRSSPSRRMRRSTSRRRRSSACAWCASRRAEHVLALTAHHIVFDGWSITHLHPRARRALSRRGRRAGGRCSRRSPSGYADFAAWQRARLAAGAFDARPRVLDAAARRIAARWSCRPTARGRPSRRIGGSPRHVRHRRRRSPGAARARPRARTRRSSWRRSPASSRSSGATPARTTSRSARRSPAASQPELEGLRRAVRQHGGPARRPRAARRRFASWSSACAG